MSNNKNDDLLTNENLNKVEEYFKLKDSIRVLRNDLKNVKIQKPETQELEKLQKKVKELREEIKEDESVKELSDKISQSRERMELLKEIIRVEMLDKGQEEIKHKGRKLRIVSVVKEMRDEAKSKSQGQSDYQSRNIFR